MVLEKIRNYRGDSLKKWHISLGLLQMLLKDTWMQSSWAGILGKAYQQNSGLWRNEWTWSSAETISIPCKFIFELWKAGLDQECSTPPSLQTPAYLHPNLESALTRLLNSRPIEGAFTEKPVHRQFIIGGASLYCDAVALSPESFAYVDRILLTRVLSPAFEDCDVFIPNFLAENSIRNGKEIGWERATHEDLNLWVGFEVPEGPQEENGIVYEFQMWVR